MTWFDLISDVQRIVKRYTNETMKMSIQSKNYIIKYRNVFLSF